MFRVLYADGREETFEEEPTLERLQQLVGGYIEAMPYQRGAPIGPDHVMYANEDGLWMQLPVNIPASDLVGFPVVGTVVVTPRGSLK